jgi:UDPglucose 6-dehydrogenase
MKIGFIGLGKLGKEAAEVMSEKYYVEGYDIVDVQTKYFSVVNTLEDVCRDKDLIFVAVPTPHDPLYDGKEPTSHLEPKDFDYSIVKGVLTNLNNFINKNQLVILISTVLPGTIRREFEPLIKNYRFIYNPYLIAMGSVKYDMVFPEMVIIGTEDGSHTTDAKILKDFYVTITDVNTRYEIGTWDEAESIKIFYNTFISTKVALVNMIQDVAEKLGNINVDVVTGALERSTKRIVSARYMKSGMGDGGSCHPRDNIALRYMAKNLGLGYDLFDSIMTAREKQAENLADRLVQLQNEYNLPIVILGKSYKPNVDIVDGSTSYLTGHFLNKKGKNFIFDQNIGKAIYLISHRNEFNGFQFVDGSVVVDMWREFERKNNNIIVIKYGNTRK